MEWNKALLYVTSLFVIQNAYCTETEIFREDVLMRLKLLEDKVASQGTELYEVRKTNVQLQKSNSDLRESITELLETNDDLRETVTELKETNADLRETVTELLEKNDDLRESITELKETNNKYLAAHAMLPDSGAQRRKANLETRKKTFKKKDSMSVGKLQRFVLNSEGPIAFTAAITPLVVSHLKHKDTIKFETVITDIGGGYNNQSGVFVAPATGIYMFSCSLMDHNEASGLMVHGEIVQNQRVLGRIFAHAEAGHRDQGAQTVFTHVNQGDQIWVRTMDNPDLGLGGELYSTFSGYLLLAM